jgi:tellurite resistance protein TerC
MSSQVLFWVGFNLFIVCMLVLDLGVFHRQAHEVKVKEALLLSALWISLALLFNIGIYIFRGADSALAFFTGYLLEESLSVDNLFVFLLIFSYFRVPSEYQHSVLFWGILGAVIMRAVMIFAGTALIQQFHWIIYIFGGFLILTGAKMAFQGGEDVHPERNPVLRLFTRLMPVTMSYHGAKFLVRLDGRLHATPLLVVLVVVEATDVVFALDSIPAIFGVTTDPFIVYTSNIFAIMGLRSIYFALSGVMRFFHYLKLGLAVILVFIGFKMVLSEIYHLPVHWALIVVASILALSVVASLLWPPAETEAPSADLPSHTQEGD